MHTAGGSGESGGPRFFLNISQPKQSSGNDYLRQTTPGPMARASAMRRCPTVDDIRQETPGQYPGGDSRNPPVDFYREKHRRERLSLVLTIEDGVYSVPQSRPFIRRLRI